MHNPTLNVWLHSSVGITEVTGLNDKIPMKPRPDFVC